MYPTSGGSHYERFAAWHESFYRAVEECVLPEYLKPLRDADLYRSAVDALSGGHVVLARRLAALDPAFGTLATYFVASSIGPKDAAAWFKHAGAL